QARPISAHPTLRAIDGQQALTREQHFRKILSRLRVSLCLVRKAGRKHQPGCQRNKYDSTGGSELSRNQTRHMLTSWCLTIAVDLAIGKLKCCVDAPAANPV